MSILVNQGSLSTQGVILPNYGSKGLKSSDQKIIVSPPKASESPKRIYIILVHGTGLQPMKSLKPESPTFQGRVKAALPNFLPLRILPPVVQELHWNRTSCGTWSMLFFRSRGNNGTKQAVRCVGLQICLIYV